MFYKTSEKYSLVLDARTRENFLALLNKANFNPYDIISQAKIEFKNPLQLNFDYKAKIFFIEIPVNSDISELDDLSNRVISTINEIYDAYLSYIQKSPRIGSFLSIRDNAYEIVSIAEMNPRILKGHYFVRLKDFKELTWHEVYWDNGFLVLA